MAPPQPLPFGALKQTIAILRQTPLRDTAHTTHRLRQHSRATHLASLLSHPLRTTSARPPRHKQLPYKTLCRSLQSTCPTPSPCPAGHGIVTPTLACT